MIHFKECDFHTHSSETFSYDNECSICWYDQIPSERLENEDTNIYASHKSNYECATNDFPSGNFNQYLSHNSLHIDKIHESFNDPVSLTFYRTLYLKIHSC